MNATARITQLRESIARSALNTIGIPTSAHILNITRIGEIFIIATNDPTNRWATYGIDTFRIPTPDDTDPDYDDDKAPKHWVPLAGWNADTPDEVNTALAKASAYAHTV
ncbi:hypothetical protein ABZV65_19510 [Streptomyces bauhiniae]|uniref:hypothetical protein n=1 Tax=Streptomyces bauhiniae TaxID=2340725 RepID=UPI0033B4BE6F